MFKGSYISCRFFGITGIKSAYNGITKMPPFGRSLRYQRQVVRRKDHRTEFFVELGGGLKFYAVKDRLPIAADIKLCGLIPSVGKKFRFYDGSFFSLLNEFNVPRPSEAAVSRKKPDGFGKICFSLRVTAAYNICVGGKAYRCTVEISEIGEGNTFYLHIKLL